MLLMTNSTQKFSQVDLYATPFNFQQSNIILMVIRRHPRDKVVHKSSKLNQILTSKNNPLRFGLQVLPDCHVCFKSWKKDLLHHAFGTLSFQMFDL